MSLEMNLEQLSYWELMMQHKSIAFEMLTRPEQWVFIGVALVLLFFVYFVAGKLDI